MTAQRATHAGAAGGAAADALQLRHSTRLAQVPAAAGASVGDANAELPEVRRGPDVPEPTQSGTPWLLVGAASLAGLAWLLERRRRRSLEIERDSLLWAQGDTGHHAKD